MGQPRFAQQRRDPGGLGVWGIATMLMFLAIPRLGLIYAYRERMLEWQ